jgi:hypothetical protein
MKHALQKNYQGQNLALQCIHNLSVLWNKELAEIFYVCWKIAEMPWCRQTGEYWQKYNRLLLLLTLKDCKGNNFLSSVLLPGRDPHRVDTRGSLYEAIRLRLCERIAPALGNNMCTCSLSPATDTVCYVQWSFILQTQHHADWISHITTLTYKIF